MEPRTRARPSLYSEGRMRMKLAALALLVAWGTAHPAQAAKKAARKKAAPAAQATLTGTVTIKGHIKKVKKFNPYSDIYGGGAGKKADKPDEPGHLCVYLDGVAGTFPAPAEHAVLDQQDRAFTTDLLPVLAGTTVDFTNHDKIYHNIFSYSQPVPFDLGRRAGGEKRSVLFDKLPPDGVGVIKVNCDIHANMHAAILVMRNPFWAVLTETGGTFTLKGVPPGSYTLTGWHVSLTPVAVPVTLKAGEIAHADLVMQGED